MPEDNKHELTNRSSQLLAEIQDLKRLEQAKRVEPISSPRFHDLAERVTDRSREIMRDAATQEAVGNATTTGPESIEDIDRADDQRAG